MNERNYKNNLRNFEASFEPQDWEAMQEKLNASAAPFTKRSGLMFLPLFERKNLKYAAAWLLLICAFAASSNWFFNHLNSNEITHSEGILDKHKEQITTHSNDKTLDNSTNTVESGNTWSNDTSNKDQLIAQHQSNTVYQSTNSNTTAHEASVVYTEYTHETLATSPVNDLIVSELEKASINLVQGLNAADQVNISAIHPEEKKKVKFKPQIISRLSMGVAHKNQAPEGSKNTPMIMVASDVKVSKKIAVGGYIGWNQSTFSGYHVEAEKQTLSVGTRGTYSVPLSDRVEVYGGIHAGMQLNLNKITGEDVEHASLIDGSNTSPSFSQSKFLESQAKAEKFEEHNSTVGPIAGVRVKIKDRIGAFVESSPGLALVQAGIHVHLK
ncbi:MAG: hypothetical protein ACPGJS_15940 [Flammeovirgaceae bacterium]